MKKPSPVLAYEAVYGKSPTDNRRGRPPFKIKSKMWKGMDIDYELKTDWIEKLNSIPNVEIRASCAGHGKEWVSYIVFRITDEKKSKKINKVIKNLSSHKNTFCIYDIGMEGKQRIVCATDLVKEENQKEWERWWTILPYRINKAVN